MAMSGTVCLTPCNLASCLHKEIPPHLQLHPGHPAHSYILIDCSSGHPTSTLCMIMQANFRIYMSSTYIIKAHQGVVQNMLRLMHVGSSPEMDKEHAKENNALATLIYIAVYRSLYVTCQSIHSDSICLKVLLLSIYDCTIITFSYIYIQ